MGSEEGGPEKRGGVPRRQHRRAPEESGGLATLRRRCPACFADCLGGKEQLCLPRSGPSCGLCVLRLLGVGVHITDVPAGFVVHVLFKKLANYDCIVVLPFISLSPRVGQELFSSDYLILKRTTDTLWSVQLSVVLFRGVLSRISRCRMAGKLMIIF